MTDRTPLAELPGIRPSHSRQFFRVVMPYISRWYEGRWTPNPKVKLPDEVTVIRDEKSKISIDNDGFTDPMA
jgi:hypothetical protein